MIDFKPVTLEDKALFESYLLDGTERGCEYAFANLYLWGQQNGAIYKDHLVLFSRFGEFTVYPYPVGKGDKKEIIDALMEDAKERGISFRLSGMCEESSQGLEEAYPGVFEFWQDRDFHDYVYDINNLADLAGRKYHRKKNHYNRFRKLYPDYKLEELNETNFPAVLEMVTAWYQDKRAKNPEEDYEMEQRAMMQALREYEKLGFETLVLSHNGEILAVTLGNRITQTTFGVHFEKAKGEIDGAYTTITSEFAKRIRAKYPEILYMNREEDMGVEGLRKSKESYYPHHMIEKCRARIKE